MIIRNVATVTLDAHLVFTTIYIDTNMKTIGATVINTATNQSSQAVISQDDALTDWASKITDGSDPMVSVLAVQNFFEFLKVRLPEIATGLDLSGKVAEDIE